MKIHPPTARSNNSPPNGFVYQTRIFPAPRAPLIWRTLLLHKILVFFIFFKAEFRSLKTASFYYARLILILLIPLRKVHLSPHFTLFFFFNFFFLFEVLVFVSFRFDVLLLHFVSARVFTRYTLKQSEFV